MEKPKYEQLRGLSPTIAIEQKSASSNPRSTVGTVTEIYDYLRVLYARAGEQRCHLCGGAVGGPLGGRDRRRAADAAARRRKVTLLAPQGREPQGRVPRAVRGGAQGRLRRACASTASILRLEDVTALDKKKKHTIELVIDRVTIDAGDRARLTDSVETALQGGRRQAAGRRRGRGARARLQRGARLPDLRRRLARAVAAVVLVQLPARHVRRLQRPRLEPGGRPRPDRARPDLSIRDGAIEPWGERARQGQRLDRQHRRRRWRRSSTSRSTSRGRT